MKSRAKGRVYQDTYRDKRTGMLRTSSTWTAQYDGKPKSFKRSGFLREEDAWAWLTAQLAQPQRVVQVEEVVKASPLLGDFLDRWLSGIKSDAAASYVHSVEIHTRLYLKPDLGDWPLDIVERDPAIIERAKVAWLTQPRKDGRTGTLAPNYVKKILATLRVALNKAKRLRLISANPCDAVDAPRVERKEMRALGAEQVQAYLDVFDATQIGAAIATALGSGCRRGELLALRRRDLDLEARTLRIERSLERVKLKDATEPRRVRYELRFKEPKTKRSRRLLALPPFVVERLRRHLVAQAERFMALGLGRPSADTLLFERDREPWVPNTFGLTFARIVVEAGLPRIRLHDTRHSYASLMLESGSDLKTVSTALGHSTIQQTADTYAHISATMLHDAAHRLDRLVRKSGRRGGK